MSRLIEVAAGALVRPDGGVLVAERPDGRALAGYLEFPGGKLEPGESPEAALARELHEELGIGGLCPRPLIRFEHDYPDYRVRLYVFRVARWEGEAVGREGQRLAWMLPRALAAAKLLPANRPVLAALELPATLLVTPEPGSDRRRFLRRLEAALDRSGIQGVIFRVRDRAAFSVLAGDVVRIVRGAGRPVFVNAGSAASGPGGFEEFDGLHLPAAILQSSRVRPPGSRWVGASVHDPEQARRARELELDYVVAGSLRETPSHPGVQPIGWSGFDRIAAAAGLPTYAIGGVGPGDLAAVVRRWGQGVAAIRAFWPETI